MPMLGQKLSKQEKQALGKAANELASKSIDDRNWVIVPSSYMDSENMSQANTDNSNFISCEGENLFMNGRIVTANKYNNIAEALEYNKVVDKKGNIRLKINVLGRMIKGTYTISIRNTNNVAIVIFTPQGEKSIKFTGELKPLDSSLYNKRSNPI